MPKPAEYVKDGTDKSQPPNLFLPIMEKIIIQIYEVQDPQEAEALVEMGVDHIGSVIVSEDDWKLPAVKDTIRTVQSAAAKSSLIMLFNNLDSVLQTLGYYRPEIVHFCEALTDQHDVWQNCKRLIHLQENIKKRFPELKIMRSIPIVRQGQNHLVPILEISRKFEPTSDFFLTDTLLLNNTGSQPDQLPVEGFVGITGQTCDWDIARQLVEESQIPVILAGGISPHNVVDAIRTVRPSGVDSCTLTNLMDAKGYPVRFKKDLTKVKALVNAVRLAESTKSIGV